MNPLFLIVQIAGRWVAIRATDVESAVDIGLVTPVPQAPRAVRGIAALRSRVVTVIDSSVSLGLEPMDTATRAIVAHIQGHHYALLIEALDDVFALEPQPLNSGLAFKGVWSACATGIVEHDGQPLLILDLERLIPGMLPAAA